MNIERLAIPEVFLLVSTVHGDARGSFSETFRASVMAEAGATRPFVQENLARTANAGQLRGLHFQRDPHAQEKLVGVLSGEIFDVAVDIRPGSQSGQVMPLYGLGVKHLNGSGRGDLIIHVTVETPTRLDAEQEKLLRELAKLRGEESPAGKFQPGQQGFFSRLRDAFNGR